MAGEFTLADLSQIEIEPLRKGVIDVFLMESDVMQILPWETIDALATTVVRMGSLPSVGFRKINEGYASGKGAFLSRVENISLMGGYFDTDKAIARAKNTIADARAITQVMQAKALAYKFNDKFINGDPQTDPEEFKGIEQRVEDLNTEGFTGQLVELGGTTGAARDAGILYDTTNRHNFLNKLDELLYTIKGHKPDFLLMNSKVLLAIRSLLRQEKLLDSTKDMFDRVVDVYQGVRMQDIGVKADQTTEILPLTEDRDSSFTSDTSTSIYAIKIGIGEFLWGIQEYPLEVEDKGLLEDKPIYRTEADWPLGLAHADPYCLGRLYNIWPDSVVNS